MNHRQEGLLLEVKLTNWVAMDEPVGLVIWKDTNGGSPGLQRLNVCHVLFQTRALWFKWMFMICHSRGSTSKPLGTLGPLGIRQDNHFLRMLGSLAGYGRTFNQVHLFSLDAVLVYSPGVAAGLQGHTIQVASQINEVPSCGPDRMDPPKNQ